MVVYIMHQGMSIPNTLNPRWQTQFLFHPGTGLKAIDGTSFMHAFIVLPCMVSVYHLLQRDVVHSLYMHCLFRACNWVEYSIINSYILVIMTIFCYTFWQACSLLVTTRAYQVSAWKVSTHTVLINVIPSDHTHGRVTCTCMRQSLLKLLSVCTYIFFILPHCIV